MSSRDSSPVRTQKTSLKEKAIAIAADEAKVPAELIRDMQAQRSFEEIIRSSSVEQELGTMHNILLSLAKYVPSQILLPYLKAVEMGDQINAQTKGQFQYGVNTPEGYNVARKKVAGVLRSWLIVTLCKLASEGYEQGTLAEDLHKMDPGATQEEIETTVAAVANLTKNAIAVEEPTDKPPEHAQLPISSE